MRDLVAGLLDEATNGAQGRGEDDPVYRAITEGRDHGKGYSSCGDLCHWLLFRCGLRAPWLNRSEWLGWRDEVNISRLVWGARGVTEYLTAAADLRARNLELGDIVCMWSHDDPSDAHVAVVRFFSASGLHTADYGQPGGARRVRRILDGANLEGRPIRAVLRLQRALSTGPSVAPESAFAWRQRMGL